MEESIDWLFDDPLPSVDMSGCEHDLKTEVKCEPGFEDQLHDGTDGTTESTVKEEVQVKVEREDEKSVMQCLYLSAPDGCGAGVLKCDGAVGSSEGGCDVQEGENCNGSEESKWHLQSLALRRVPETGLGGVDSLGLAQGEQCMEGVSVCKQEQAVDRPASCVRCVWCPMMKVEGGGVCGSVCVREEEEGRDVGSKGVVQPQVFLEDCKEEVKPESCVETGVERHSEGDEQEVEGGVHLQARAESSAATGSRWSVCAAQWSEGSSASLASSSSSSPAVSEPRLCVSSQETPELSPLEKSHCSAPRQKQCRKKGSVQSAGSVVHQEAMEVSSPHSSVKTVHEGLRKYPCPHCPYRAGRKHDLQTHINTVHEGLKEYPCPHCPYRAGQKGNLQTHISNVHEGLKEYPCPHCPYRAGQKGNLQTHISNVHERLRKYPCPHCQYRAGQKGRLNAHIDTVHEGLREYPCPHCPYRASERRHLKRHVNTVHEGLRKYACPHCPYRAGQKSTLQTHMDTVHEESRKYPCPHCPYSATRKGYLQTHILNVHENYKKYPCPHCLYRSGWKGYLQVHIETVHEGLRKYPCPHCRYKAGQKSTLQKHIKMAHEGERK